MNANKALESLTNKELLEGLKNPEKAKEIILTIQSSLDDIVNGFNEMKQAALDSQEQARKAIEIATLNADTIVDLTTALKNIHIILGAHKDMLPDDLKTVYEELSKFVLTGAAIKIGVIKELGEGRAE